MNSNYTLANDDYTLLCNNAAGAAVNLMGPGHVDTVFIAGRVRKWRGNLVGVDTARVRRLAAESRDAVMRRANFRVDLLG